MVRPLPKLEPAENAARRTSYNPLYISLSILRRCIPPATSLRIASLLVPLLVCLSLIPLLLLLSLFSGWYIWKNIPVTWQTSIFLQYGDGPSPYAELLLPTLSTAQPYDISLQLVLPASEANFVLGNFMATLSLSTSSNKTLVTVSRPAIVLPPKRPAYSFSGSPRLINLDVPLLSSYVPVTSEINARVNIGRRDGWRSLGNGEGRELSVSSAALRGAVRRHGVWGLVSRFPLTFALGASVTFFSLSFVALAACFLPAVQRRVPVDEAAAPEPKEDRPVRARKRPRRNIPSESRAASTVRKSEDVPVDISPAHISDDFPLRRRRSRMSDVLLGSEN